MNYTKHFFSGLTLKKKDFFEFVGKEFLVGIDRPFGTKHKGFVYPFNYGYIYGFLAGDGKEADVYVIDDVSSEKTRKVKIIGVVYRKDDVECKLVGVVNSMNEKLERKTVENKIRFQEERYDSKVYLNNPDSI